jgi:hypothetical protein
MNFFKAYSPLNSYNEAVVYLVQSNQKLRELHKLQMDSITLEDKKNKIKNNQPGNVLDNYRKKTLNIEKI